VHEGIGSHRYNGGNADLEKDPGAVSGFCHQGPNLKHSRPHVLYENVGPLVGIQKVADFPNGFHDRFQIPGIHCVNGDVKRFQTVGDHPGIAVLDGDTKIRF